MTTLMFNEISYTTKGTSKVRCLYRISMFFVRNQNRKIKKA